MKKIIVGYVFSLFTSLILSLAIYSTVSMLNGAIYMIIPAIICFYISMFFAWMIGDMSWNYGEDDEK